MFILIWNTLSLHVDIHLHEIIFNSKTHEALRPLNYIKTVILRNTKPSKTLRLPLCVQGLSISFKFKFYKHFFEMINIFTYFHLIW